MTPDTESLWIKLRRLTKSDWEGKATQPLNPSPVFMCKKTNRSEWRRMKKWLEKKMKKRRVSQSDDFTFRFHVCRFAVKAYRHFAQLELLSLTAGLDKYRQMRRSWVGEVFISASLSVTVCMKGLLFGRKMTFFSPVTSTSRDFFYIHSPLCRYRLFCFTLKPPNSTDCLYLTSFFFLKILVPYSGKTLFQSRWKSFLHSRTPWQLTCMFPFRTLNQVHLALLDFQTSNFGSWLQCSNYVCVIYIYLYFLYYQKEGVNSRINVGGPPSISS